MPLRNISLNRAPKLTPDIGVTEPYNFCKLARIRARNFALERVVYDIPLPSVGVKIKLTDNAVEAAHDADEKDEEAQRHGVVDEPAHLPSAHG